MTGGSLSWPSYRVAEENYGPLRINSSCFIDRAKQNIRSLHRLRYFWNGISDTGLPRRSAERNWRFENHTRTGQQTFYEREDISFPNHISVTMLHLESRLFYELHKEKEGFICSLLLRAERRLRGSAFLTHVAIRKNIGWINKKTGL